MKQEDVHIFGIRHHGPGSARSLGTALADLQPDCLLVEGPPDADGMIPFIGDEALEPPVALLLYVPDAPRNACYYPFAAFSPEWAALRYALEAGIPARFMDLPQAHQLAERKEERPAEEPAEEAEEPPTREPGDGGSPPPELDLAHRDPLGWMAQAAGFSDGERWWEHMVEHRRDGTDLFAAILEAMSVLREAVEERGPQRGEEDQLREARREAWMRQTIRRAQKEGFQRIAVVCGAWHAPALRQLPPAKVDDALLKGLPKTKVEATWVPWTHGRLCWESGYGAGVESPGWYDHLWRHPDLIAVRWMARVASLLREADLDASSASVIEAVRLAETLAALRERPLPGLAELSEATQTVLCFGNEVPLRLIRDKLIIGERLGKVPEETPTVPLQQDLMRHQKRLRLPAEAAHRDYDLDLRKETDMERSRLLHRLTLLGVSWGSVQASRGTGTFREVWRLQWQPELAVDLIQAGVWGNTVLDAATAFARSRAEAAPDLPALTALADQVLLAELPDAVAFLMTRLEGVAAVTSDVAHMMDTLPRVAEMIRYPNVRQTDRGMLQHVLDGLVTRICIGLPGACSSLDDEAAERMYAHVVSVHRALALLENEDQRSQWRSLLAQMSRQQGLHGLIAGRCTWLAFDCGLFDTDETARQMGLALSTASDPPQAGAWVDGFLRGNGQLLIHTEALFHVLDQWISSLRGDAFTALLPLLRRTFSTFPAPERRNLGERVKSGGAVKRPSPLASDGAFDEERAAAVLPLVRQLLGLAPAGVG